MNNKMNIFCFVGGTGSGKTTYLNSILEDKEFLDKNNIQPLIYGTTRAKRDGEKNGVDYFFYSKEEFFKLNKDDMIEFREYNTINNGIVYYFTTIENIIKESNIICSVSPDQYDLIYAKLKELDSKKYNLIILEMETALSNKVRRLLERSDSDDDIYEFCRRIVKEREEFENSKLLFDEKIVINNNGSEDSIISTIESLKDTISEIIE